jgi:hypothetical protein
MAPVDVLSSRMVSTGMPPTVKDRLTQERAAATPR